MKNISFIGGPAHGTDRIIEDNETVYSFFGAPENLHSPTKYQLADNDIVIPAEHVYKESAPDSLIFIYQKMPNRIPKR